MPRWFAEIHDDYLAGRGCPWWKPAEEPSDYQLFVMAHIHAKYEAHRLKTEAELTAHTLKGLLGG